MSTVAKSQTSRFDLGVLVHLKRMPRSVPPFAWSKVGEERPELSIEETSMPRVVAAWAPGTLDERHRAGARSFVVRPHTKAISRRSPFS
jgi:hypothetical protein